MLTSDWQLVYYLFLSKISSMYMELSHTNARFWRYIYNGCLWLKLGNDFSELLISVFIQLPFGKKRTLIHYPLCCVLLCFCRNLIIILVFDIFICTFSVKPVSTKGKPTKLHKRKHQIGSLYFDMKQKEMELQERRSKGFLTKAETQAKYGW